MNLDYEQPEASQAIPLKVNRNNPNWGYDISVSAYDNNGATNMRVGKAATAPEAQKNPNFNLNTPALSTEAIIGPEGQMRGNPKSNSIS